MLNVQREIKLEFQQITQLVYYSIDMCTAVNLRFIYYLGLCKTGHIRRDGYTMYLNHVMRNLTSGVCDSNQSALLQSLARFWKVWL